MDQGMVSMPEQSNAPRNVGHVPGGRRCDGSSFSIRGETPASSASSGFD